MAVSNSANLAAITKATKGLGVTLGRSKGFRRQLRSILGVEQNGSVVAAVRAMKARNEQLENLASALTAVTSAAA